MKIVILHQTIRARLGYQIQIGEQRSRGIELNIAGEILPEWKVTASYAYTNAEIIEDNDLPVGDKFQNTPLNQASLWTSYEIQNGNFKGLGFGLGLFYVGEREATLPNTYTVGDYLRTNAAIYTVRMVLMLLLISIIYLTQNMFLHLYLDRPKLEYFFKEVNL